MVMKQNQFKELKVRQETSYQFKTLVNRQGGSPQEQKVGDTPGVRARAQHGYHHTT